MSRQLAKGQRVYWVSSEHPPTIREARITRLSKYEGRPAVWAKFDGWVTEAWAPPDQYYDANEIDTWVNDIGY